MQNTLPFSWGQVAQRVIFKHVDPVRCASLKEKFELFEDPCVYLVVQDVEIRERLNRLCNHIGASVVSCNDVESLLQQLNASPALCPTVCIIDSSICQQSVQQIEKELERHFSARIFQLTDEFSSSESFDSTISNAPKPLMLPIDNEEFTSDFNEFLIMASQLAGHLRRIQKLESLNERERILVQLISFGVPNKSSASILKLAEKTVEKCRTGVYRKLDVRSTGELASLITMANFYRWPKGAKVPFKTSA